jgi:hypothetical protein
MAGRRHTEESAHRFAAGAQRGDAREGDFASDSKTVDFLD